ncbi:MAG TPA: hypothetical protein VGS22_17450 [Thermoanaerobaculia bacterium]|jgi:6-phosphofructokinase 1|nr:hypothetical protein [Thermoanaerobaculia bacterium]
MRAGVPDALDRLVASNFANLAADLILGGKAGFLTAVVGGRYAAVPLEEMGESAKRVDVERFYDRDAYRPKITGVLGLPMFLS